MLLTNATLVLPERELENSAVLIERDRIARILNPAEAAAIRDDQIIDLKNARLFAGFIDVHNHGAVGVDVNAASARELSEMSKFLAANGVTAWLPTFVPDSAANYQTGAAAVDELIKEQDESDQIAARAVGVHYEGPFVNEKQCGALQVEFFKTFADGDELSVLPTLKNPNARHLITVAPEIANGIELVKRLVQQNWIVAIGHTRAEISVLDRAFAAGARHITHFFNQMTGLHHRDLGVVGWGLANENVTVDIIADGIHVAPAILKLAHRLKTTENMILISDSIKPAGLGDGDFMVWNERISVTNGQTRNRRGSLAGSVITMLDAVKTMLSLKIPACEVSQMASLNPARLLNLESDYGSIETGKRADLTALDNHGNVVLTVIGGRIAHSNL